MRRLATFGACLLLSTACAGSGAMQRTGGPHLGTGSREVIHMIEYPEMFDLVAYQVVRRIRRYSVVRLFKPTASAAASTLRPSCRMRRTASAERTVSR